MSNALQRDLPAYGGTLSREDAPRPLRTRID